MANLGQIRKCRLVDDVKESLQLGDDGKEALQCLGDCFLSNFHSVLLSTHTLLCLLISSLYMYMTIFVYIYLI